MKKKKRNKSKIHGFKLRGETEVILNKWVFSCLLQVRGQEQYSGCPEFTRTHSVICVFSFRTSSSQLKLLIRLREQRLSGIQMRALIAHSAAHIAHTTRHATRHTVRASASGNSLFHNTPHVCAARHEAAFDLTGVYRRRLPLSIRAPH